MASKSEKCGDIFLKEFSEKLDKMIKDPEMTDRSEKFYRDVSTLSNEKLFKSFTI